MIIWRCMNDWWVLNMIFFILWCNFSTNWIVRIVWHLLVIIYVKCIYVVVGEYIRILMYICRCWWIYTYVDVYILLLVMSMLVWTCGICTKHILLWSSPSSHMLCCCCLSSPIVVVEYFGILYAGCYGVFISVRGDSLRDERNLVPHLVESSSHIICF